MDTILIILFKRPDYTRQVLTSLMAQPELSKFHVHFQIDGFVQDVVQQAVDFTGCASKSMSVNGGNYGCTANLYAGLTTAFNISEFVIVVEDDCLVSHDFLKYMLWAKPLINDDCRTISGYHKNEECPPEKYNVVHWMPRWTAWSWATTRKHWEAARQVWDWSTPTSWDLMIAYNYFWQRKTVMPYLSRCKNIGAENGTYTVDASQHERDVLIHKWSDSVKDEKYTVSFGMHTRGFKVMEGLPEGFVFQEEIPESEQVMWDESREFLYKDLKG